LRLGLATEESDKYSAIDLAAAIEKFPVPVAATTAAPDPFRL
jgi:hypothetical protein